MRVVFRVVCSNFCIALLTP
nr:hypothetical protein [Vibrio diabolicus]